MQVRTLRPVRVLWIQPGKGGVGPPEADRGESRRHASDHDVVGARRIRRAEGMPRHRTRGNRLGPLRPQLILPGPGAVAAGLTPFSRAEDRVHKLDDLALIDAPGVGRALGRIEKHQREPEFGVGIPLPGGLVEPRGRRSFVPRHTLALRIQLREADLRAAVTLRRGLEVPRGRLGRVARRPEAFS